MEKRGVALVGSCLVDELLPVVHPGELTYVDADRFVSDTELKAERRQHSVGGMALNVGVDLAKIAAGYPVAVIGKVGADARADLIRQILHQHGISSDFLLVDPLHETSWTQVIYVQMADERIERIFRHTLGAMGAFRPEEVILEPLADYRIVMVGYGLLLPQFDLEEAQVGTRMALLLQRLQQAGHLTAVDFVSPSAENLFKFIRYRQTLKYVDICCINDDQAMALAGCTNPAAACRALVDRHGAGMAVVHCGAVGPNYAYRAGQTLIQRPNFVVKPEEIAGNAGAGDAFSAGFLHGFHQRWEIERCLDFAAAAAAISLRDASTTGAMRSEAEILTFMQNGKRVEPCS